MNYGFNKRTLLFIDRLQREGFATMSFRNEKLLDDMIRALVFQDIWQRLFYFYLAANDGSVDVARINLRNPFFATVASGSPVFVSKKGIYGSLFTGFAPITHSPSTPDATNTSFWAYSVEGGGSTVASQETMTNWNDGTWIQTIRNRTNPRVDAIVNATIAGPVQIVATAPQDNTLYFCDVGNQGGFTKTGWANKTMTYSETSGTGTLPASGSVVMQDIPSTRQVGAIGGGMSLRYGANYYSNTGGFADIIKTYMDAVQLL